MTAALNRPELIEAIRALRRSLRVIDDAIEEAQCELDAVEVAAGLVREDGSSESDE